MLRFLRSPSFPIFMIVFVDVLGVGITIPVLPLYAQYEFKASAIQITLLVSVYFAAQFFASPRLGRLSDRVGRRPVLILSQAGTFLALLLSGAATSLPLLYLARAIDGVTGGNVSVAQAYLSDITDERNRARGLGLIHAAFATGFIIAPALGSFLAVQFGPRVAFFVAAGFSLLTVTLSWRLLPESLSPERRQANAAISAAQAAQQSRDLVRLPGVVLILVIGFLGQLAFFSFQSTYVLWAEAVLFPGRDARFVQQMVGATLTYVGVCGVIAQAALVGPLVRRFGERAMVTAGSVARAVPWALMVVLPNLWLVLAVIPVLTLGGNVAVPALMALLTFAVPHDRRGYAIGLMESAQGLGRIAGPILAGWTYQSLHPSAPFGFAALATLLAALASAGLWQHQFRHLTASETAQN